MPRCRVYSLELKVEVARRLVNGESVSAGHDELGIRRGVLYRWRDVYRKEGAAGLRLTGRPTGVEVAPRDGNTQESARRIAELERKIGQQAETAAFLAGLLVAGGLRAVTSP
jgi:transposase-like protein